MGRSEHVTVDMDKLTNSLNSGTQFEQQSSESQALCACVYRIPKAFRRGKQDACTPQVISIGPYHYDSPALQRMNGHKERYLEAFLNKSQTSRETFLKFIKGKEARLRNCHFEPIALTSNEFVEIILADVAFIHEFFYRCRFFREEDAPLTSKNFMAPFILCDTLLLENQLPYFIIKELLDLANIKIPVEHKASEQSGKLYLLKLAYEAYSFAGGFELPPLSMEDFESLNFSHFLDFVRFCYLQPCRGQCRRLQKQQFGHRPRALELQQAGVQFRVVEGENISNVRFDSKKGILEIPFVGLHRGTELLFKNLVIFEQLHYMEQPYFTSYILGDLVNEQKDVEILVHNKIIKNDLPDSNAAAALLNNITEGVIRTFMCQCYFDEIRHDLCLYYRNPRWRFLTNLKQNYLNFSSPWAAISVLAGFVLLVLTFLQIVYTIKSLDPFSGGVLLMSQK